jgi:hypothetical protein
LAQQRFWQLHPHSYRRQQMPDRAAVAMVAEVSHAAVAVVVHFVAAAEVDSVAA